MSLLNQARVASLARKRLLAGIVIAPYLLVDLRGLNKSKTEKSETFGLKVTPLVHNNECLSNLCYST